MQQFLYYWISNFWVLRTNAGLGKLGKLKWLQNDKILDTPAFWNIFLYLRGFINLNKQLGHIKEVVLRLNWVNWFQRIQYLSRVIGAEKHLLWRPQRFSSEKDRELPTKVSFREMNLP